MTFNLEKEEGGGYFLGVAFSLAVVAIFSLYLTFGEVMDRLEFRRQGRVAAICDVFKYLPLSIWAIYWTEIGLELKYGRVLPRPKEKKGGGKCIH